MLRVSTDRDSSRPDRCLGAQGWRRQQSLIAALPRWSSRVSRLASVGPSGMWTDGTLRLVRSGLRSLLLRCCCWPRISSAAPLADQAEGDRATSVERRTENRQLARDAVPASQRGELVYNSANT